MHVTPNVMLDKKQPNNFSWNSVHLYEDSWRADWV